MFHLNFSLLELLRFDATIAGLTSLATCVFLIVTKGWHGKFSMDGSEGVQKLHTCPTPRIGGLAIALGVIAGFAASSHDIAATEKRAILSGIILAGIPAFIFGLLEDLTKRVSVRTRLLATMASGVLGWGITGVSLNHVAIPGVDWLLSFTIFSVLFTAFAVGGVANAFNIIDGFNGLSAGVALVVLATFGFIARQAGDIPLAFSCLVLAGSIAGFLVINWPYGKIFLGDGGAYFVGFALAWIAVLLPQRNAEISPWTSLLVCAYPVLEVAFSYYRRHKRKGHHPGEPDRVHLHHMIHRRVVRQHTSGLSKTLQNGATSPFLWALCAVPCIFAVLSIEHPYVTAALFLLTALIYSVIYSRLALFKLK